MARKPPGVLDAAILTLPIPYKNPPLGKPTTMTSRQQPLEIVKITVTSARACEECKFPRLKSRGPIEALTSIASQSRVLPLISAAEKPRPH